MFSGGLSPLARGTPRATSATRINNRFIPAGAGNSHGIWQTSSTCTVYPRWRGELDSKPVTRTHQPGLSPLARGTHDIELSIYLFFRFIPAGAGNSRNEALDCRNYAVYPRWRGELILFAAESLCRYGLSPLARGTHRSYTRSSNAARFIPAGAGNSLNITYY